MEAGRGQNGIQLLLAAEQEAQHIVNTARNSKPYLFPYFFMSLENVISIKLYILYLKHSYLSDIMLFHLPLHINMVA